MAHKLSTIENANRIIVLADGVVVEEGNHTELFNAKGVYYKLLQSQEENKKGTLIPKYYTSSLSRFNL